MNYELNVAETYLYWHRLTSNVMLSKPLLKLDSIISELADVHYDDLDEYLFFPKDENTY